MKYSLINHWGAGWSVVRSNIFTAAFKQANRNSSWFCQMDLQQVRGSRMEITMCYEVKEERMWKENWEADESSFWVSRIVDGREGQLISDDAPQRGDHGAQGCFHRCRLFSDVSCWDKRSQTCCAEQGCAQTPFTEKTLVSVGCYRFNFY